MISQFYGKRVSIPRLREYAKTDKLGTNLYGLIQAGKNWHRINGCASKFN